MRLARLLFAIALIFGWAHSSFALPYSYNFATTCVDRSGSPWKVPKHTTASATTGPTCTIILPAGMVSGTIVAGYVLGAAVTAPTITASGVVSGSFTPVGGNLTGTRTGAAVYTICIPTGTASGTVTLTASHTTTSTYSVLPAFLIDGADQSTPCGTSAPGFGSGNNLVTGSTSTTVPTGGLGFDIINEGAGATMPFPTTASRWVMMGNPNASYGIGLAATNSSTYQPNWGTASGQTINVVGYVNPCGACTVPGLAANTVGYVHTGTIMACIGDSICDGYQQFTPPGYINPFVSPGPVGSTLADVATRVTALNPSITGTNHGIPGETIVSPALVCPTELNGGPSSGASIIQIGEHPNYVFLEGGVNDMHNGVAFSSTPYDNCLTTITNMGATTIVEEVYPVTSGYADPGNSQVVGAANIQAWNTLLDAWATSKSLVILPQYTTFASPPTFLNSIYNSGDGLHPDQLGVGERAVTYVGAMATPAATTVETRADGAGIVIQPTSIAPGGSVVGYSISRDSFGNFLSNVVAVWSLTSATGGVISTDLVAAVDNMSATFTGHTAGSGVMTAVANTFTGNSGAITVGSPSGTGSGIMRMHP